MTDRAKADARPQGAADPEARLRAEGLEPGRWGNAPYDAYTAHAHDYDKVLVCVEGSITFALVDDRRSIDLAPGDRLDLPAGTNHSALAGPRGVSCLEAHLPAGSIAELSHRNDGSW